MLRLATVSRPLLLSCLALGLTAAACDVGGAADDAGTAEPDGGEPETGEPDVAVTPLEQEACDSAAGAGMALTASDARDTAPSMMPGMVHSVTLPASGTGFVALNVETEHLDWQAFFGADVTVALTVADGPLTLIAEGANPGCPSVLPAHFAFHGDTVEAYVFEVTGAANATVKIYAAANGSDHSPDGGHHHADDGGHHHAEDGGHHHAEDGGHHHVEDGGHHHVEDGGHHHAEDGGHHHAEDGGHHHVEDGGHHHAEDGGHHHVEDGGHHHVEDGGHHHVEDGGHHHVEDGGHHADAG